MNSFLTYITSPYATLVLLVVIVLLLITMFHLYYKMSIFMRGENARSFEENIRRYFDQMDELKKHDEAISQYATNLDARLAQSIRNISTVRYKAFDQASSNQSFAIALVNERGDGVIISSLHHPNHSQVFAKPVVNYLSSHDLTEEELAVLSESRIAHGK